MTKLSAPKIGIVDYSIGNIGSLRRSLEQLGCNIHFTRDGKILAEMDALVLPGVGAYRTAMATLDEDCGRGVILDFVASGRPLLGICLGMQLLMSWSSEGGRTEGLNIVPGGVRRLRQQALEQHARRAKIPQIGWNAFHRSPEPTRGLAFIDAIPEGAQYYFLHGFVVEPEDSSCVIGETTYGGDTFCSVLAWNNVYGCQFHPEKSGALGKALLTNFVSIASGLSTHSEGENVVRIT